MKMITVLQRYLKFSYWVVSSYFFYTNSLTFLPNQQPTGALESEKFPNPQQLNLQFNYFAPISHTSSMKTVNPRDYVTTGWCDHNCQFTVNADEVPENLI